MRRNRRKSKRAKSLLPVLMVCLALLCAMTLAYWLVDSKCASLGQEINRCERQLTTLNAECVRQECLWKENKTPERLAEAMLRHGIAMDTPAAEQVVHMSAQGTPLEGQLSLRRFRAGWSGGAAAVNKP